MERGLEGSGFGTLIPVQALLSTWYSQNMQAQSLTRSNRL